MTVSELNDRFALPGALHFEQAGDLLRAQITLESCAATVYLQGAHLTHWQPAGHGPVLFLSERSEFAPGKAIRGGVPVCFPWFGPRSDGQTGPSHGFARLQPWEVAFAALLPGRQESSSQAALHLTFTLAPTPESRALGFDHFRVAYEMIFGTTLTLRLSVANLGEEPLIFEEALHSYFAVADVRRTEIAGLGNAPFLDKRDSMREKIMPAGDLRLQTWTDRVFPANPAAVAIHDEAAERVIHLSKVQSQTTIVWNPWAEGTASIADLSPDAWTNFLCVEAGNTGADAVRLVPGEAHTLEATLSVAAANAAPPTQAESARIE